MNDNKWRLPHGLDELLPPAAGSLERLRRAVLDLFEVWGYEYIEPPLVEYLESLLVGSGRDLDLQTLKVVDQQSGQMLGIRADMTSQAVRIDAHSRRREGIQRLCYAGPVIHANPRGALDARIQFKAGAELFGSAAPVADAEVVTLMLEALAVAGVKRPVLLLGHMGVFRSLVAPLGLTDATSRQLFEAVQRKSETDIADLVRDLGAPSVLVELPGMMGDRTLLATARRTFANAPAGVGVALQELEEVAERVAAAGADAEIRFDLSELSGYGYHNGPVFAAYQADQGAPVAQGGRYDGIGAHFGCARPATGFDMNLHRLLGAVTPTDAIWVPWQAQQDSTLAARIRGLRKEGQTVVQALGEGEAMPSRCVRELVRSGDDWVLRSRHGK